MDINVTFRHTESSQALRDHIVEKITKMLKYTIKPVQAHVVLTVERPGHTAEITLLEGHHNVSAKHTSPDMWDSANGALAKLQRQLQKVKEKVKNHHA